MKTGFGAFAVVAAGWVAGALGGEPEAGGPPAGKAGPACLDRTGIRWTLPFKEALVRAKAEHRLLMIKPIAFGTTPDGGW